MTTWSPQQDEALRQIGKSRFLTVSENWIILESGAWNLPLGAKPPLHRSRCGFFYARTSFGESRRRGSRQAARPRPVQGRFQTPAACGLGTLRVANITPPWRASMAYVSDADRARVLHAHPQHFIKAAQLLEAIVSRVHVTRARAGDVLQFRLTAPLLDSLASWGSELTDVEIDADLEDGSDAEHEGCAS